MAAPPNVSGHSEWQMQNLTVAEVLCRGIRKSPALTCMVQSCCSAFSVLSDIQSQEYYWVQKESVKRKHHRLIFPKPGVWRQEKNALFLMHPKAYGCKYLIRREAAVQYAVKQKALRIHFQSIMYRCIPDLPE